MNVCDKFRTYSSSEYAADFFYNQPLRDDDALVVDVRDPPNLFQQLLYRSVATCSDRRYVIFGQTENGDLLARTEESTLVTRIALCAVKILNFFIGTGFARRCYAKLYSKIDNTYEFRGNSRCGLEGAPSIRLDQIFFKNAPKIPQQPCHTTTAIDFQTAKQLVEMPLDTVQSTSPDELVRYFSSLVKIPADFNGFASSAALSLTQAQWHTLLDVIGTKAETRWEQWFVLLDNLNHHRYSEEKAAAVKERLVNDLISDAPLATTSVCKLPQEIWSTVFNNLSVKDLNNCSLVCKSFRSAARKANPISPSRYSQILRLVRSLDLLKCPDSVLKTLNEIPAQGWVLHHLEDQCTLEAHNKRQRAQVGLPRELVEIPQLLFADQFWNRFQQLQSSTPGTTGRKEAMERAVELFANLNWPKENYARVLLLTIIREGNVQEVTSLLERALLTPKINILRYLEETTIQERTVFLEALSNLSQMNFPKQQCHKWLKGPYHMVNLYRKIQQEYPNDQLMVENAIALLKKIAPV